MCLLSKLTNISIHTLFGWKNDPHSNPLSLGQSKNIIQHGFLLDTGFKRANICLRKARKAQILFESSWNELVGVVLRSSSPQNHWLLGSNWFLRKWHVWVHTLRSTWIYNTKSIVRTETWTWLGHDACKQWFTVIRVQWFIWQKVPNWFWCSIWYLDVPGSQ